MSLTAGTRLIDRYKFVSGFGPALPSTSTSDIVNFANYNHVTVLIEGLNATTVTGSAITLLQSSDVAGTGSKALAFTKVWANLDTAATDTLVETAVVSNTFTTTAVNSKSYMYMIEIDATDLDINNSFTCVQVALATGVATSASLTFILSGPRHGGALASLKSAIL